MARDNPTGLCRMLVVVVVGGLAACPGAFAYRQDLPVDALRRGAVLELECGQAQPDDADERRVYQDCIGTTIERLGDQIRQLKTHARGAPSEHLEVGWEAQLRELESQRSAAITQLSELRATHGQQWDRVRIGLEQVLAALQSALDRTSQRIQTQAMS